MVYPTMTYRNYILKYTKVFIDTKGFFCLLCNKQIDKQRWIHFKKYHRYKRGI
jgi:hypothetical protein